MRFPLLAVLILFLSFTPRQAESAALGTAFTYQGRIDRSGLPVNDTYSIILRLFDAATGGTQIGTTQTLNGVVATNGLFNVTVDFGASAFTNQARWLDIQLKGSTDAAYTTMSAREPITAVPFAMYALNGPSGTGPWGADGLGDIVYNGGNVLVGPVTAPGAAKVDVQGGLGIGLRASVQGSSFKPINAALFGLGLDGGVLDPYPAMGVWGTSTNNYGVYGASTNSIGVYGTSTTADGVYGYSAGTNKTGVVGISGAATGKGGYFRNDGGGVALYSDGLAKIKTLQILGGADLAERFEADADVEPGTVMAIDPASPGRVRVSDTPYARTVAGVVSGANGLNAGVELSKDEAREGTVALALTGRVWVRCDANRDAIHPGDLLTSSPRPGHAMRVRDAKRAQGAILGKAMTSLENGTGLVLVLVSLQ